MFFTRPITKESLRNQLSPWVSLEPQWISLQFNNKTFKDCYEAYTIEAHTLGLVYQINWGFNQESIYLESWRASKKGIKGWLKDSSTFPAIMAPFIHQNFGAIRELLVQCGKRKSSQEYRPSQESQGKEWLRVTLELLKEALKTVSTARNEGEADVLSGLLFCGEHPTSKKFVFRLRIFNLDIEILEDEVQSLRCTCLDKKKGESFDGLNPAMTMVFSQEKEEILNYMIKILPYISECLLPL